MLGKLVCVLCVYGLLHDCVGMRLCTMCMGMCTGCRQFGQFYRRIKQSQKVKAHSTMKIVWVTVMIIMDRDSHSDSESESETDDVSHL